MADLQNVMQGLEQCSSGDCTGGCAYFRVSYCQTTLEKDALELLKEQQETIASLQGTICKLNAALAEQPEQKHGHWISLGDAHYTCSCCRTPRHMNFVSNYCSECGARMDEEVEQE